MAKKALAADEAGIDPKDSEGSVSCHLLTMAVHCALSLRALPGPVAYTVPTPAPVLLTQEPCLRVTLCRPVWGPVLAFLSLRCSGNPEPWSSAGEPSQAEPWIQAASLRAEWVSS